MHTTEMSLFNRDEHLTSLFTSHICMHYISYMYPFYRHAYLDVDVSICIQMHPYVCIQTHMCIYISICTCMYTYVCTRRETHTQTHRHTHLRSEKKEKMEGV